MKSTISLFSFFLLIIFFYSCNSNEQKISDLKKYSAYNDLEKMSLKGDVIGIQDYSEDLISFNDFGFIEKSISYGSDADYRLKDYIYVKNILKSHFTYNSSFNLWTRDDYTYDEKGSLINEINNSKFGKQVIDYKNNANGFPTEYIQKTFLSKTKTINYWTNSILDSSYGFSNNGRNTNIEYFTNGRISKRIVFDEDGEIDKKYTRDFVYVLDSNSNDIKQIFTNLLGEVDSSERKIFYKNSNFKSNFIQKYIALQSKVYNLTSNNNIESSSDNYNEERTNEKQWVNCSHCHGTGIKECTTCYGKGKMQCGNCNGTGIWGYNNTRCVGCGGKGEVRCDYCYGKGNKGNCGYCYGKGQILE